MSASGSPPAAGDQPGSPPRDSGTVWHPAREWLEADEDEDDMDYEPDSIDSDDRDELDAEQYEDEDEDEDADADDHRLGTSLSSFPIHTFIVHMADRFSHFLLFWKALSCI